MRLLVIEKVDETVKMSPEFRVTCVEQGARSPSKSLRPVLRCVSGAHWQASAQH